MDNDENIIDGVENNYIELFREVQEKVPGIVLLFMRIYCTCK